MRHRARALRVPRGRVRRGRAGGLGEGNHGWGSSSTRSSVGDRRSPTPAAGSRSDQAPQRR
ncbi:hypothetical protein UO65_5614 [Actinokineospora spheciospongiae]|uniref:Uncharacterized protein n=1 Tax=Actinokineospora spheciospongiae TaxID=909613 RepID=W7IR61_9PSEU|nr:hypothetical protein UO65_5614 [Actinokineospora spheciospongiae]